MLAFLCGIDGTDLLIAFFFLVIVAALFTIATTPDEDMDDLENYYNEHVGNETKDSKRK